MAIVTNTHLSIDVDGTAGSLREDLSDIITNLAPLDKLFYDMIKTGKKPTNWKHEFLNEGLRAAATNAQIEAEQYTPNAMTNPTRLYNVCQIQAEKFLISRSLQEFKSAGDANSVEHKSVLHSNYLMKDVELAFLQGVRTDRTSTAGQMRGALNATQTNVDLGGGTMAADGTVSGGTPRYLGETMIKDGLQNAFVAGGNPTTLFCGPFQKRKITEFASYGNYRTMVEEKKLTSTVDVLVMEFGELRVRPHRNFPTDVVFGCDPKTWKKSTLASLFREKWAKTADGDFYVILVEHTLEFLAEDANFRIVNLLAA